MTRGSVLDCGGGLLQSKTWRMLFAPNINKIADAKNYSVSLVRWQRGAGGQEVGCGWLKDKYGLSWQVVPEILGDLLRDKDAAKSGRVMQALVQMVKLDIKKLKDAYAGKMK